MDFQFEVGVHTTFTTGDIYLIEKKAWQYLWFSYKDDLDENARMINQRPFGAYVEDVLDTSNFAQLGIGS